MSENQPPFDLSTYPLHLGLGATALPQPEFTGEMDWYEGYGQRNGADGAEGRLVSMHSFSEDWDVWEMHPRGSEVVLVTTGTMVLHQETDGEVTTTEVTAGSYVINAPGVWHTADVPDGEATALFITAGEGTEHRPR